MSEYKSFMAEGYSIGAHAESLYGRGYKHYGTMGQGNKQVHIFTPSKGKVDHHMLLKHDGADPTRHEGQPDLKKIKGMTEMVETTDVIGIQKAKETKAQRQDRNVNEEDDETISEGWLFGSRYKKIGNKSGSTHRVTFKHIPTDSKHTVDVTAPTDRHAEAHVHRHVLGGRNGTAPIKITRMQHLHEGKEVMEDDNNNNLQELSIKKLNAYQSKATKEVRQIKSNSNYGAERGAKKLLANRKAGIERANKSRIAQSEDLDEALEIRHAINHGDSQARHHAREHKKALTAYNAGHAKLASQYRAPTRDQEDELMNHYEVARFHHGEYKKRLAQLDAGKNEDLDLQEISKGLAARYLEKAKPAYDAKRKELNKPDHTGPVWGDMKGRIKKFSDQVDKLGRRREGINRAQDRLKEEEGLQELSKNTLHSYLSRARGNRNAAANRRDVADEKWEKANKSHRDGTAKTAHTGDYHRQTMKIQSSVSKAADRTIEKRTKGIASARARLTKEDLNETARIGHEAHKARVSARLAQIKRRDGSVTLHRTIKNDTHHHTMLYYEPKPKWTAKSGIMDPGEREINIRTRKLKTEDLDEGIVSRTLNAIKNANKRLTPASERIAQTREKVGYDNAKSPDLRPRGKALRKVERIEWEKENPVTRPKPIVPMGKLPDKLWSKDSDKPKPKRVTDDSLDQPMFRKAGAMSRRFKSEELEIRSGQKVLKEKPKRGPDGKLIKSKAASRVEDCIKMSGKKQKIDTEPSYNPLTTAGGGGTPNA